MVEKARATSALVLLLSVLASAAFAHGDLRHVLGTVREIAADHVVVETKEGAQESIAIDGGTRYFRGDAPAKPNELTVGDRVVVHATHSDPATAKTIRFSSPAAGK